MTNEEWRTIFEFPNYQISSLGRVYNIRRDRLMSVSCTNHGHAKIKLTDFDGTQHTRSVALLVASSFVEAPNLLCDQVIMLDGDLTNLDAQNLAWRPQWFAWRYTRQLKEDQPVYYHNLNVVNLNEEVSYNSIVEAGVTEGLLFDDIWRSTYQRSQVFPHGHVFEIVERV